MAERKALSDKRASVYRSAPFWAWNGKLDKEELKRQLVYMKKMGFGGVFMHSRTGLATEYLGGEWFACIRECAQEAEKLGLKAWLYDEDRWPSGSAGGIVSRNPRFRSKFIDMKEVDADSFAMKKFGQGFLNAFAVKIEDGMLSDYYPVTHRAEVKDGYAVQVYFVEEMQKSDFYNGFTYIDTLSREATEAFLRSTHELYKKECGELFGKQLIGIFMDEPQRGCCFGGFGIDNPDKENLTPFTYDLPRVFRKRFGYELLDRLPELYFGNTEKDPQNKWSLVAYDYMLCLEELFLENYAKPIHDWCRKNKLFITGHILHEDSLCNQAGASGSVQQYYEYMDYPGIDILGEENYGYWIAKQVDSVKKQLGRKLALSEMYGATGWQFPFEGHKFLGDWQAVFGINFRCQHLSWYTMEGEAKRDYPASIFFQSAWYKKYQYVEDYFARMNLIASTGKSVTEVLIINPVESVYGYIRKGALSGIWAASDELKTLETQYTDLFYSLTEQGVSFDIGDEAILKKHAKIEGDVLRVGKVRYRTVIFSGCDNIRKSTLDLLNAFSAAGGNVIVNGQPRYIGGRKADRAETVNGILKNGIAEAAQTAKALCRIKLDVPKDVVFNLRFDERKNEYYLLLVNTDRTTPIRDAVITLNLPLNVQEIDLRENTRKAAAYENDGKSLRLTTNFAAGGERCFLLSTYATEHKQENERKIYEQYTGQMKYSLSEPNVAVLDLPKMRFNETFIGEGDILLLDRKLRNLLGMNLRGGGMVQPWYREKYGQPSSIQEAGTVELTYFFDCKEPFGKLFFAMEQPERYMILFNGIETPFQDCGYYVDPCIRKTRLDETLLKIGKNCLELRAKFTDDLNLEALYLLGNFGAKIDGTNVILGKIPETLDHRSLKEQGFPFYSGIVTFDTGLLGVVGIKAEQMRAACYEADWGSKKQVIAFPPYASGFYRTQKTLKISAYCTRRNTFGPLHLKELYQPNYGPDTFLFAERVEGYNLIDEGLSFSYRLEQ